MEAIRPAVRARSQRIPEPLTSDDVFLPIAAEAEAASLAAAELPAAVDVPDSEDNASETLPSRVERESRPAEPGAR